MDTAVRPSARPLRVALDLVGVAFAAVYLATFVARNVRLQWDARTYLWAAHAALAGLDPYRLDHLARVAGHRPVSLPFVYPPVALLPFLGLSALPIETALAVWIGFKVALLAGLVVLWRRLDPRVEWLPLAVVAVFGFNGAALWDLRAGNVALLEAAGIWAGLAAFVAGRRGLFAACVVAASTFKLAPVVFLLLLLVPTDGRRPRPGLFALALGAWLACVAAPFLIGPGRHWSGFLTNLGEPIPVGESNPSVCALFLAYARPWMGSEPLAQRAALAAWIAFVLTMLAASVAWLRDTWRGADPRRWAYAAVGLFLLIEPRPMAYGYVLLLPVSFALAPRPFDRPLGRLGLALILCAQGWARSAKIPAMATLAQFTPALLWTALWLLTVRAGPAAAPTRPPTSAFSAPAPE